MAFTSQAKPAYDPFQVQSDAFRAVLPFHERLVLDFLGNLAGLDRAQADWRAPGSRAHVLEKGNFQTPARNAYRLAASAIAYEANHRPQTARNKWREIFGPTYP